MTATTKRSRPQIVYDAREEIEQFIDKKGARVALLEAELKSLEGRTFVRLAASAIALALPFYLISTAQDSRQLRGFNAFMSLLGVGAAGFAVKTCGKFQEMDRIVYKEQGELGKLKAMLLDAEESGFDLFLTEKVSQLMPQPPQAMQQVARPVVEWAAEARTIMQIFRKYDVPITVNDKEVINDRIYYTISPTTGVDPQKIIDINGNKSFRTALLLVGIEDPQVVAVVGKLLLQIKNPFHQPAVTVPMQPQQREPEPVPVQGGQEQPQQQQYQQPMGQQQNWQAMPDGLSVTAPQRRIELEPQESELFTKFLKAPHNWVCGKTGGGKTFLLSRLVIEWVRENPDGEVYILDRNFGKPDRVTGEIFDWNGIDERCVYNKDADILHVLETQAQEMMQLADDFGTYAREQMRARRDGREFNKPAPQKKKVLLVLTEENAIAEEFAPSKLTDSEVVKALRPILQQGNGYGYKVVLDGQSIAVNASGIQESIRQQLSVCMVGENCVTTKEVRQFGSNTNELVARCEALRAQGKRACIIQLGEGAPVASVVPEMDFIRDFRFNGAVQPSEPPEVTDFDNEFKSRHGFDPDEAPSGEPSDQLTGDDPYTAICEWIKANHPDRVSDRHFPDDVTLNKLWVQWFNQNGRSVQPLRIQALLDLRKILNAKRGLN